MIREHLTYHNTVQPKAITGICPHCTVEVLFRNIYGDCQLLGAGGKGIKYLAGLRICPRPECEGFAYFLWEIDGVKPLDSYPSVIRVVDAVGVPSNITRYLNEALECASNQNYYAAAVMIRRTLEELCASKKIKGKQLVKKLENLQDEVTLPPALFKAMKNIRLLGNDAAHVLSKTYDDIQSEHIEIALSFTQEILRGVYHYDELLKSMEELKTPKPSDSN